MSDDGVDGRAVQLIFNLIKKRLQLTVDSVSFLRGIRLRVEIGRSQNLAGYFIKHNDVKSLLLRNRYRPAIGNKFDTVSVMNPFGNNPCLKRSGGRCDIGPV